MADGLTCNKKMNMFVKYLEEFKVVENGVYHIP